MNSRIIKIAVLGDQLVGKTCLLKCYFGDEFSNYHVKDLYYEILNWVPANNLSLYIFFVAISVMQ
jgi:GTPase SAR1 family protein